MNQNKKGLGRRGEDIATDFLRGKGYKIIERNYSKHFSSGPEIGEIDIIVQLKRGLVDSLLRRRKAIHFVEVKSGFYNASFSPEMRVDQKKKRQITKIAEIWLNEHHIPLNSKWQIDVISIILDRAGRTKEIKVFEGI